MLFDRLDDLDVGYKGRSVEDRINKILSRLNLPFPHSGIKKGCVRIDPDTAEKEEHRPLKLVRALKRFAESIVRFALPAQEEIMGDKNTGRQCLPVSLQNFGGSK